jgi:hypothetical protein
LDETNIDDDKLQKVRVDVKSRNESLTPTTGGCVIDRFFRLRQKVATYSVKFRFLSLFIAIETIFRKFHLGFFEMRSSTNTRRFLFLAILLLDFSLRTYQIFALTLTPSTAPEQIIKSQLAALQKDDMTEVFQYASPGNKAQVGGDVNRFAQMVKSGPYQFLIGHSKAELLLESSMFKSKQYLVRVVSEDVKIHEYWWSLSRCNIEGPWLGCYMVDAVIPNV